MKRIIALSACVLISVAFCYGEWYWSSSESIDSENGACNAKLLERPSGTNELQIFDTATGRLLWTRDIDWPRDCYGLVSNDGKVFAVVNDDYSDKQYLVVVYTKDDQAGYSVREIKIDLEYLILRDKKYRWIELDGDHLRFSYDAQGAARYLDLMVFSGKTLEIGLR